MDVDVPRGLLRALSALKNPRMDRTKLHSLADILTIAINATLCGADDWSKMTLILSFIPSCRPACSG